MRSQLRCWPRVCDCLLCSGLLRLSCPLPRAHMSAAAFAYMQQQAAAHKGLWPSKGVRTGGRHQGQAGERLPKQRPKPCSCSYGRPCRGSWRLTGRLRCPFLDPGFATECAFFVLRSLACLPACPLCLRTVFTCLPTPTGTLIGPHRPSVCPSACLLPLAVLRPLPFPASVLSPLLCTFLLVVSRIIPPSPCKSE